MCSQITVEQPKYGDVGFFHAWIYAYLLKSEMKETAECFFKQADPWKMKIDIFWGTVNRKVDKIWNLYISDDQHELNELKRMYEEFEAWRRKDAPQLIRMKYFQGENHLKRRKLLCGKKIPQMETIFAEDVPPNDIIDLIISKHPYMRFINAIFRYMIKSGMLESLCLLKKESGVPFINPRAFDVEKDDLYKVWRFYNDNARYIRALFKGDELVTM